MNPVNQPQNTTSTPSTRRAVVLKNYVALRRAINRIQDPWSTEESGSIGHIVRPNMTPTRWQDRLEYLLDIDTPPDAAHLPALDAIDAAEGKLSGICLRFIHATDPSKVDNRAARQYLFDAFGACERAWAKAASAGMVARQVAGGMGAGRQVRVTSTMGPGNRTRTEPMGVPGAPPPAVQGKMGF